MVRVLFLLLTRFHVNVATATNEARKFSRQKLTHAYHAFASYVRHEGHLYEVFLVLAIRTGVKGCSKIRRVLA